MNITASDLNDRQAEMLTGQFKMECDGGPRGTGHLTGQSFKALERKGLAEEVTAGVTTSGRASIVRRLTEAGRELAHRMVTEDRDRTIAAAFPELVAGAAEINPAYGPAQYLDATECGHTEEDGEGFERVCGRPASRCDGQHRETPLASDFSGPRYTARQCQVEVGRRYSRRQAGGDTTAFAVFDHVAGELTGPSYVHHADAQEAAREMEEAQAALTTQPEIPAATDKLGAVPGLTLETTTDEAGTTWVSYQGPREFVDELGRTWRRVPGLGLVCRYIDGAPSSECWPLADAERSFGLTPVS